MTIHLCTFSDESMSRAADLCILSALHNGVGGATHWSLVKLRESGFYLQHEALTSQSRGLGYWAWKPWIILKLFDGIGGSGPVVMPQKDDILIYADAGVEFINNISHIMDRMDQDIFLFGNNWEHAHWCKRDVVEEIWPLTGDQWQSRITTMETDNRNNGFSRQIAIAAFDRFGKQCQASVIFFRVSDYSRKFVAEWLKWCLFEGGRLIDDSPSRAPNHPEFRENRHDQAILTTMAYREGIKLHYWPASYNDGAFSYGKLPEYAGDNYPILFSHHRKRNHEFQENAA
jgi:hypothetical protein